MHLQLGPGERAEAGALDAAARALADASVAAVLLPLAPTGGSRTARAARRYVAAWDARLIHDGTWFAPAARVAARAPVPGATSAEAAPLLRDALDGGRRVVALREARVLSPFARDLDAWVAWARREGAAWGALARRDARFRGASPVGSWPAWARHNVAQATRRVGEVAQALRRADPEATWLHVVREAAWTAAYLRTLRQQSL